MYRIIGADGREYGPVSVEELRRWIAEGRVNQQTRVRAEASTEWKTLAELPEVSAAAPPPLSPAPKAGAPASVPNYLVPAILVTLCCCLPLGIPAIVFAAQVNGKLAAGDVAGAQELSRKAKTWCWIAFGLGLLANIIVGILYGVAAMSQLRGRMP
jgi:hypothetical protein